jgi:TIR domain
MPQRFDPRQLEREMRAAQRRAETEWRRNVDRYNREVQREVDRVNRENQRRVDEHNRQADLHNRRVLGQHNRRVERVNAHNRAVDAQNRAVVADLSQRLNVASANPRYTVEEQALADRVQQAVAERDDREWDTFLSYARIDGVTVGQQLRQALEDLRVRVWFDEIAITPGTSQALQMDKGLQKARAGIVLLTPAYLVGRFWTERELGALLHKEMLIPVLHEVTFSQVAEYSGILPDLAGFETARDSVEAIAEKIAAAVART